MRNFTPFLLLQLWLFPAFSQVNLELVSRFTYDVRANDIWGYVAPDGTEYALVGLRSGVSIVSLANPADPQEVAFVEGSTSIWRDLKVWKQFAYVTTDQPGTKDGLLVIDLSGLPGIVTSSNWTPDLPGLGSLFTCHNLFIDEFGFAYLAGCNVNQGGAVIVDVSSDPSLPNFVGKGVPEYAHDVYVRNNKLYTSEIFSGNFSVYDVTDKSNPVLLATQPTPMNFTHNAWLSDDGTVLFTTDERPDASTTAYDISDLTNIRLLDEFRPIATLGTKVIPHNVHVLNDFLVISHYTDGCIIVDAARPQNLIEVGNFDTHTTNPNGFHGDWGAYPFLPSGLILVSDVEGGLFVLQPDYQRACYLEGTVTDAVSGNPLKNVTVEIQSGDANLATTDLSGDYQTGQVTPGDFEVAFSKIGYFDTTATATLINGELTILDIGMAPLPIFEINGSVREKGSGAPIPDAFIVAENPNLRFETTSDDAGNFSLPVITDSYNIYAGKWGFENGGAENQTIAENQIRDFELGLGFQDNFNLDLGWTVSGDAEDGTWVRAIPKGTIFGNDFANPNEDVDQDFGPYAYVTGNEGIFGNDDDVDRGATLLHSPPMDLTTFAHPFLSYYFWFINKDSNIPANDSLTVFVSNGTDEAVLGFITESQSAWRKQDPIPLSDFIEITNAMQIIFRTSDLAESGHVLEVGIDAFAITDGLPDASTDLIEEGNTFTAHPNPFQSELIVEYKIKNGFQKSSLLVFNVLGQKLEEFELKNSIGTVRLNADLETGLYFLTLQTDGRKMGVLKVIKKR